MPDQLKIIWVLAIGLSAASITGYLAHRLKLSPILGYLLAGYLIGPNASGFSSDQSISDQLANIGVTLLMFAVGLNFNWKDISQVKKIVIPGAITLSFLSITAGIVLGVGLGESLTAGFVIGIAICVSSTVVIVHVLTDQGLLRSRQGYLVLGWTIIEDLISVLGLILLPSLIFTSAAEGAGITGMIGYLILTVVVKIALLALVVRYIGETLIENMLKVIARTRSHELFTLTILACVFLISVGSAYFFGISIALGAFIAGTVVGKTALSHQAAANALPMRDAFSVIFFLSVGMLFNPVAIHDNPYLFLGILSIVMLFRPLAAFLILKIAKFPSYMGLTVSLAISQMGEYSFILAEEGSRLQILPGNAHDIIIACAFISIALNPILFQLFKQKMKTQKKQHEVDTKRTSLENLYQSQDTNASFLPQAMVIGYGPVGKAATAELAKKYRVTVIDQNIDTVSNTKGENIEMLFGDARQLQILERANVENIDLIAITTPEADITQSIIEVVQHANPHIKIIARVHFKADSKKFNFENIPVACDEEASAEKMSALLQQFL
jgi:monovalent cation:H+ antiporter-2, CPA2 family